ncbi:hypothetical protein ES705_22105 [subsurface metagenome]
MMNDAEIRVRLLSQINNTSTDKDLSNSLEELSLFNSENQLEMEPFYNELNNILSWGEINSISQYLENELYNENLVKINNILSWAFQSWKYGIEHADINKAAISFILIKRLKLRPKEDLDWKLSFIKIKDYFKKSLPKITFDVNTHLPESAPYGDRKFHSDYDKALKNNNYRGILIYLNALERGGGFNHFFGSEFIQMVVILSVYIDELLIADNLDNYSPLLIKFIIDNIDENEIVSMLSNYNGKSPLPFLIGLIRIVNPNGNNSIKETLLEDYEFIKRATEIVKGISERVKQGQLYSYITGCSNIFMNKLWHSIFAAFLVDNPQFADDYISNIDFTYDIGEYAFNSLEYFSDETSLNEFSKKVYFIFLEYLKNLNHQQFIFVFTSYYKFILRAIRVLSENKISKYYEQLEQVSIEVNRGIYSWELNKKYMLFTKWVFWILTVKKLEYNQKSDEMNLKHTFKLLRDNRVMNILCCEINEKRIDFSVLINFLDNPESVNEILLPSTQGVIKLGWKVG